MIEFLYAVDTTEAGWIKVYDGKYKVVSLYHYTQENLLKAYAKVNLRNVKLIMGAGI